MLECIVLYGPMMNAKSEALEPSEITDYRKKFMYNVLLQCSSAGFNFVN